MWSDTRMEKRRMRKELNTPTNSQGRVIHTSDIFKMMYSEVVCPALVLQINVLYKTPGKPELSHPSLCHA